MNSCKTHISKNLSNKVCVKEGAGGKSGVLKNYQLNNTAVACAKLYNKEEFEFYETVHKLSKKSNYKQNDNFKILSKYIPKSYNIICEDDGKTYFVIENLMPNKESIFMDLKLGYKSAIRKEAGFIKYNRHRILDKFFTVSNKYGFRLEGSNFPIMEYLDTGLREIATTNKRSKKKYKMQRLNPIDIFLSFFSHNAKSGGNGNGMIDKKDIKNVIKQLKELIDKFCLPNIDNILNNGIAIGLIGVSIFIYKSPDSKIKLIDFAHPSYVGFNNGNDSDRRMVLEEAINFTKGLESILDILETIIEYY